MKKTTFKAVFVMAILLLGFLQVGKAQLFVDNFSYTVGTALNANGWAVQGVATPTVNVTGYSITYPGYMSSGVGDEVTLALSGEDVNHTFAAQTSGSVYASCLVNVTSATTTGDYFFHFGASTIASTFHGRVFVKKDASNNVAFGISRAGAVATAIFTPFSYALNTTYLLVLKYTFVAGLTNDITQIYINPTFNAIEPTTGWTTSTDIPTDLANVGTIALRQGGATTAAGLKIDGIRVATTWADIVGAAGGTPTITAGSLTGFGYQAVNTTSAEQSYAVSGTQLQGNIIITPPVGFEISTTTGGPYIANPATISLTPNSGTVLSTPIYVVFHPTAVQAYTGNILHTSTNAIDVNTAVSGTSVFSNPEPTNHATNFAAGTATTTAIPLTWTDATGGQVPVGYLIKASPTNYSSISDPVDGTPEANSALVQNVAQGVGTFTFTGLNSGTPYFFKIYPYTNSGATIAYNTTSTPTPVPTATATTIVVPYLALYEDFNYAPPAFIGGNTAIPSSSNNWVTHSGGSGTIDVQAGNLNYAGLAASSGYSVRLPGSNATCDRDVNRALTITPNTSAVMYYSALINIVDASQLADLVTSDYFIHFNAGSGSTASTIYGARLAVMAVNTFANYRLSIKNTSGTGQTFTDCPTDLNFGQTYLVVVKYDRSASPTVASLWVDPTSLGAAEPAGATINASGDATFLQFGSISFRNSTGTPKVDIDEVRIGTTWADVTPVGVATLATTPTSLSDFIYFVGSGPSPSQSFTITAAALTPTSGTLTVTGSAAYEVSSDNVTFGPSANIAYSLATFTSAPVFVRLKAGLPVASYLGQNVTISGGGATSTTVTCNGTVAALTPIIIIPGSLTTFGNQALNTPSSEKTYSVSGSYLTGNIIITPPVGFEISTTSGGPYIANPATITLTPTSGTVASTPIYVVFNPALLQAYTGNILHASAGAVNVNVAVSGTGIKGEPTNFPTLFATGTVTSTSIPLTWTDATTGTFIPDGYLIKGSAVSYAAIVAPADLVPEVNSALVENVLPGVQTFTFNSLIPGGTYYFKIFPYTNSGSAIDYKSLFPPQASAQTLPPPVTTYTWNQTVAGSWAVATNWTPTRTTPALNDILVIDGASTPAATLNSIPTQIISQLSVIGNATVNLQGAAVGVVLTIAGAAGTDLTVAAGSTLNVIGGTVFNLAVATGATAIITGNMSLAGAAHKFTAADAGGITFNSPAVFSQGTGFTSNPFGTSVTGVANSVYFATGSTYAFTLGSNPFALTAPASIVVFQPGSLYRQLASASPSFSGRAYANVEFNFAATFNLTGAAAVSMDNLTVSLGTLNCNFTADPGHSIKGNIVVATGAALTFTPATAGTIRFNGTSAQSITLNGTGAFTTGVLSTIEINNAAGVTLNNPVSLLGGLKFTNGLLTIGSNNLTLGAASTISGTPSAASMIVATGSGEVRKTFTTTGSFVYPVGDNTGTAEYSPVSLSFTTGAFTAAYAGVSLKNQAFLGVTGNHLNRYWDVTSSGIDAFTCDAQFNYVPADVIGTESSIYCVLIPSTNYSAANTTGHFLTATGVTTFGTFTGREPISTSKTLNLTSVLLQGLYAGGGILNQATDGTAPQWPAGVADHITVELHTAASYATLAAPAYTGVELSTTGTATITVDASLSGNYWITVKHPSHIETVSATAVSFAGSVITQSFGAPADVYAGNLLLMGDLGYTIFGGDVTQDGIVDGGDMSIIENLANLASGGYLPEDCNGDGVIDGGDMNIIENNANLAAGAVVPTP